MSRDLMRLLVWCAITAVGWPVSDAESVTDSAAVSLVFVLAVDSNVYHMSDYGEPPQMAIWIEHAETREVRTVFVTRRTGTGIFEGTAERPVSLPIWIGVFRKETGRDGFPTPQEPFDTHITGATPQTGRLTVRTSVPRGSHWRYYIEMNVSGDFTVAFPRSDPDGFPDAHGNGQPSLIYQGDIKAIPGTQSIPHPIGRSRQFEFTTQMISDLSGFASAKKVLTSIVVTCREE